MPLHDESLNLLSTKTCIEVTRDRYNPHFASIEELKKKNLSSSVPIGGSTNDVQRQLEPDTVRSFPYFDKTESGGEGKDKLRTTWKMSDRRRKGKKRI